MIYRRDMNLNVDNNVSGWYKRQITRLFDIPPGVANTLNGVFWDVGPATYPDVHTIDWVSPLLATPIFQYKIHLFAQINDGKTYFKGLEIIQKNAGIIYAGHWRNLGEQWFPRFVSSQPLSLDFYDNDWFDSPPESLTVISRGKAWVDGPPL